MSSETETMVKTGTSQEPLTVWHHLPVNEDLMNDHLKNETRYQNTSILMSCEVNVRCLEGQSLFEIYQRQVVVSQFRYIL